MAICIPAINFTQKGYPDERFIEYTRWQSDCSKYFVSFSDNDNDLVEKLKINDKKIEYKGKIFNLVEVYTILNGSIYSSVKINPSE